MARAFADELRRASVALTDPALLRALLDSAAAASTELRPLAPEAAQAPIAGLAAAVGALRASLEPVGYEIARVPPDVALRLHAPDVVSAITKLDAFVKKVCS